MVSAIGDPTGKHTFDEDRRDERDVVQVRPTGKRIVEDDLLAGFDAIAVGGTTALTDNPQLTARGGITPRKPPVRIVFDRRAMLNSGVSLVQTAREVPTWVVASPEADPCIARLTKRREQ